MSDPKIGANVAPMSSDVISLAKRRKPKSSPAGAQRSSRPRAATRVPVVGTISDGGVVRFTKKALAESAARALTEARQALAAGFYYRALREASVARSDLREICDRDLGRDGAPQDSDALAEFGPLDVDFNQTNDEFGRYNLLFVRTAVTILRQDWRQTEESVRSCLDGDGMVEDLMGEFRRVRVLLGELVANIEGAEKRIAATLRRIAPDHPSAA